MFLKNHLIIFELGRNYYSTCSHINEKTKNDFKKKNWSMRKRLLAVFIGQQSL
jgi:hypothetical protein